MIKRTLILAALVPLALTATAGVAAADQFGAIAYSPSTKAYGWSIDNPSRGAAERSALARCRERASDCIVSLWFKNACGALASGPNGYGTGLAVNRAGAEGVALQECRKHSGACAVRRWACTAR